VLLLPSRPFQIEDSTRERHHVLGVMKEEFGHCQVMIVMILGAEFRIFVNIERHVVIDQRMPAGNQLRPGSRDVSLPM